MKRNIIDDYIDRVINKCKKCEEYSNCILAQTDNIDEMAICSEEE